MSVYYHGSKKRLDLLLPKMPSGGGNGATIEKAIYATDNILVATFLAIIDKKKLLSQKNTLIYSWYFKDDIPFFGTTPNVLESDAFSEGWIYELEPQEFIETKLPHEFKSDHSVKPLYRYKVNPNNFLSSNKISILPKSFLQNTSDFSQVDFKRMGY